MPASGSAGKLIHAADACHIFAVDLRGGTGAAVLAHKNGRHPHALPLQGAHLRGGVGYTGGVLVGAAQRVLRCGWGAAAVVGAYRIRSPAARSARPSRFQPEAK